MGWGDWMGGDDACATLFLPDEGEFVAVVGEVDAVDDGETKAFTLFLEFCFLGEPVVEGGEAVAF